MYTVEIDFDSATITSMDDTGQMPDVKVELFDDVDVQIKQYDEVLDTYQVINMKPKQWLEITTAMHSPEGVYRIEYGRASYYE
jgi:hypothetical protein